MIASPVRAEDVTPIGAKLLVRKYERPEKIGSIWLNPAWRIDNSRSLWEVERTGPKVGEVLGLDLEPGWIVVTPPNRGVHAPQVELESGQDAFFIYAGEIGQVIPWEGSEDE